MNPLIQALYDTHAQAEFAFGLVSSLGTLAWIGIIAILVMGAFKSKR